MKSTRRAASLAALLLLSPLALAQPGQDSPVPAKPAAQPPGPAAAPQAPFLPPPPPATGPGLQPTTVVNRPFAPLWELDPQTGKVKRIDGILDVLAVQRNPTVDQATREKIRPLVQVWLADVDQLVIDNLDFVEKIEPPDGTPGVLDTVKVADAQAMHYVAQIMTQLMSAGPLSAHLEQKEGFTKEQSSLNQQISSDYLQQLMNEALAENGGVPNTKDAQNNMNPQQKEEQANRISRFVWQIASRDAMVSYHRMLEQDAPHMAEAVKSIQVSEAQRSGLNSALDACKNAKTAAERRQATRRVLDQLTFEQRREALARAREMAPAYDPIAELGPPIPPPANAGQPINTQPASTPATYTPQPAAPQPATGGKGGGF